MPLKVLDHWDTTVTGTDKISALRDSHFCSPSSLLKNQKTHLPYLLLKVLLEKDSVLQGGETCYFGRELHFLCTQGRTNGR